ncbi:RNA-binding protein [Brevundimonas lutea]|uniref:RNA-binding protein n=1 Tax=Brevundimonas lutea TaxID=2293980 RepID=UPI000F0120E3|nr:RNA-binding protein [Brevundimonas lutea]
MSLAKATSERERRDLVTREVMEESRLIRFVAGPDGQVVPDLARRLPGRGLWVAADRASVETAAKKGLFARAAKAPLKAAPDLPDTLDKLLKKRCLEQLGLARREGVLISGFEKSAAAIRGGRAVWLIEASDGSADGRGKLLGLARHQVPPPGICGAFSAEELGLALGLENVIHAVLLAGGRADRWTEEVQRLAGFRALRPGSWDQATPSGGAGAGAESGSGEALDGRGSGS